MRILSKLFLGLSLAVSVCVASCVMNQGGSSVDEVGGLQPIPDKLVVLTFDDRSRSWLTNVAPLLKQYGFGASFFVTEADWLAYYKNDDWWISWQEVKQLHEMGFEIGNHTHSHPILPNLPVEGIVKELELLEDACEAHGIPRPRTLAVPNGPHDIKCVEALARKDYLFARRGITPEYPDALGSVRGPVYDPEKDHPYLIPSTLLWASSFTAESTSGQQIYGGRSFEKGATFEDFVESVNLARDGKIAVLTFHGVPDYYSHCTTTPEDFARCMKYLHDEGYTVIALRDLVNYVDPNRRPADPYQPIRERMEQMEAATAGR